MKKEKDGKILIIVIFYSVACDSIAAARRASSSICKCAIDDDDDDDDDERLLFFPFRFFSHSMQTRNLFLSCSFFRCLPAFFFFFFFVSLYNVTRMISSPFGVVHLLARIPTNFPANSRIPCLFLTLDSIHLFFIFLFFFFFFFLKVFAFN